MDNLSIMEQQVHGLRERLEQLRVDERLLQRAAGLRAQQEKDRAAVLEMEADLAEAKRTLEGLRSQKAQAMQSTANALAETMGGLLPFGRAAFDVDDDGSAFLGWQLPGHGLVPHGGLSGGQRVLFESALAYALLPSNSANAVIITEGAELGGEISLLLQQIAATNPDAQILVCTCHELTENHPGWRLIPVEEVRQ